jgi:hypothetical protein
VHEVGKQARFGIHVCNNLIRTQDRIFKHVMCGCVDEIVLPDCELLLSALAALSLRLI